MRCWRASGRRLGEALFSAVGIAATLSRIEVDWFWMSFDRRAMSSLHFGGWVTPRFSTIRTILFGDFRVQLLLVVILVTGKESVHSYLPAEFSPRHVLLFSSIPE